MSKKQERVTRISAKPAAEKKSTKDKIEEDLRKRPIDGKIAEPEEEKVTKVKSSSKNVGKGTSGEAEKVTKAAAGEELEDNEIDKTEKDVEAEQKVDKKSKKLSDEQGLEGKKGRFDKSEKDGENKDENDGKNGSDEEDKEDERKKKDKKDRKDEKEKAGKKGFALMRPFKALGRYLGDSWKELKQVRWPTRGETWKMTGAVLVYCAIMIVFVAVLEVLFTFIFEQILQ